MDACMYGMHFYFYIVLLIIAYQLLNLSVRPSLYRSIYRHTFIQLNKKVRPPFDWYCLSVYLAIHPYIYLSIHLSIYRWIRVFNLRNSTFRKQDRIFCPIIWNITVKSNKM